MAGFGGTVKLTGESEYRKALSQISQSLKVVSSEMKSVSSAYGTNDADTKALANQSKQLSTALNQQKSALQNLKSQLSSMESEYKKSQTAHNALVSEYDKEKTKLLEIGKTLGTSSTEYKNQQKVVKELEGKVQESSKAFDAQTKAINTMRIQTANAETTANNTAKALDKLGNETEDAAKSAEKAGDGFTVFKGVLANLASQAITKAIEGVKRLGTAIVDVGKQAVGSQAEYEQLVGGVETLFKNSAKEVQKYADNAYKTAGLSANQYMETVTSFSASLLQGLNGDTAKAAKIADMAIIDMSDNANKMGTSMEMIQNAYQGFAKDNFTMLDNLKLGYGGTASEMARLINETGVMGKAFKATAQNVKDVPFDKMLEAIHKVQTNMGITGTTAKEASETIQGSVNSMKSAWQNLLTGISNSQLDRKQLVKNFTESIKTAAKNLVPTVKQTIKGLVETAEDLLNTLMGKDMFHFDGDAFVKGVEDTVKKVINVFKWFIDNRELVISAIKGMLAAFVATKIVGFVSTIVSAVSALKTMVTAAQGATTVMKGLSAAMSATPIGLVTGLVVGLGTALFSFISSANGASDSVKGVDKVLRDSKKSLEENTASWEELTKAQQENVNKGMTEMSHYEALANELSDIVDENGRVKKGYEDRAAFITTTLKNALGIEISMTDGVIKGYGNIEKSIQNTIAAKKAKIQLDAQEALYNEALQKQGEVIANITNLEQERTNAVASSEQAFKRYTDAILAGNDSEAQIHLQQWQRSETTKNKIEADLSKQEELYSMYVYNIGQYEDNMAKFSQGKYNEMSNIQWDFVKDFQSAEDAQKAELEESIKHAETQLALLNKIYSEKGDERVKNQITEAEKTLGNLRNQMKQYNSTTETELKSNVKIWDNTLGETVSKITGSNVEFRDAGDDNVQMYVDGVATGEKKSKAEMYDIVQKTIGEISKQKGAADTAGQDLIRGVNTGIGNQNQQSGAFRTIRSFGNSLLSKLRASLQEHSPSKATRQMGIFLLQGLGIGIESEENSILNQIEDFGESVVDALSGSLEDGVSVNAIQGLKAAIPSDLSANVSTNTSRMAEEAQIANTSLVASFKQALGEMKIEMDDQEFGRFVDNTVTKLVYN